MTTFQTDRTSLTSQRGEEVARHFEPDFPGSVARGVTFEGFCDVLRHTALEGWSFTKTADHHLVCRPAARPWRETPGRSVAPDPRGLSWPYILVFVEEVMERT